MNPITIPNITIPVIGLPTIGIPSVGFPSASGGGLAWPAGLKESIKAIYDPAKQGMTNYDVIEAYAEDFTYWTLDNTGITSTPKKIVIPAGTELKYVIAFRGFNSFTAGFDIKYTGNAVITYRYNKEDGTVGTIAIDKSGIYHLPASVRAQKNFGFYCNPQTVTEEATIEQLPTSILKDLSGNGNHAYLYGGKGKLNSGMGVYQQDFSKLIISRVDKKQDPFSFTVSGSGGTYLAYMQLGNWNNKAFKILANINAKNDYLHLRFRNNTDAVITSVALKNGENIIPAQNIEGATKAVFEYSLKEGETITITQIPDYPDQLCYDGKMYAVCYGFPILTDYTVMADRTWFDKTGVKYFLSKYKENESVPAQLFKFEWIVNGKEYSTSLGRDVEVVFPNGITWQTKTSYNGKGLPNSTYEDGDLLLIGKVWLNSTNYFIGCHGAIIVADRSFTEEEINWLKDNWEKI